jgi:glucan phosphoethanolaminetransferase (alkaline phosphatase superfamily)
LAEQSHDCLIAGHPAFAVLALLIFFGIPAWRRSWRNMLGLVILMAMLGSLVACGGFFPSSSMSHRVPRLGKQRVLIAVLQLV